jgi:hypothetical protein
MFSYHNLNEPDTFAPLLIPLRTSFFLVPV